MRKLKLKSYKSEGWGTISKTQTPVEEIEYFGILQSFSLA